jgi:hypothetical protein
VISPLQATPVLRRTLTLRGVERGGDEPLDWLPVV